MLYIFDLDDTLIPTSDVITPVRLAKIAIRYGLTKAQKDRLEALNAKALYSKDALLAFAEEMGIDMPQVEDNLEGVERRLVNLACLRELPYEKAIVTAGDERLQQEKIDFFGVDRGLFKEIVVSRGDKGVEYARLAKGNPFTVIGDRIDLDLRPAKVLGGTTVHVRQGRGRLEPITHPDVDFSIMKLEELKGI